MPASIKVSFNGRTAIKFFSRKRDQELYQPGYPNINSAESEYQRQLDRRRKELLKKQVMTTWTLLIYVMPVPHYYSVVYDFTITSGQYQYASIEYRPHYPLIYRSDRVLPSIIHDVNI
jgi:hypothetical protein